MPRTCHGLRSIDMKMRSALEGLSSRGYQREGPIEQEIGGRLKDAFRIYAPNNYPLFSPGVIADKELIATLFRDDERKVRAIITSDLVEKDSCLYQHLTRDLKYFDIPFAD